MTVDSAEKDGIEGERPPTASRFNTSDLRVRECLCSSLPDLNSRQPVPRFRSLPCRRMKLYIHDCPAENMSPLIAEAGARVARRGFMVGGVDGTRARSPRERRRAHEGDGPPTTCRQWYQWYKKRPRIQAERPDAPATSR